MSTNNYPVQVRMREMSKQEEILMKKKREIERKLKDQPGGRKTSVAKPASPKPPPPLPPLPPAVQPVLSDGAKNKFNNDGSFFEQFLKMSNKNKTEVKEEKYSPPYNSKASEGTNKLQGLSCQTGSRQIDPAWIYQAQDAVYAPRQDQGEPPAACAVKVEPRSLSADVKDEPENLDWFKDALKRAQAKAKELSEAPAACSSEEESTHSNCSDRSQSKKRKSRWGGQPPSAAAPPAPPPPPASNSTSFGVPDNLMDMVGEGEHFQAIHGVMVTRLTRNNPAIVAYAQKVFGSLDLTDAQWKQCEEQMKMNVVFQLLQAKKRESERLEEQGRVKYEYDSDEDTSGGTWEHKRRAKEMYETQGRAVELTCMAEGKHHIGDFLPPEELARFIEKYRAIKEGRDPDLSDYQEHKLTEDNVGYRMLKSMGWTEGMGLGAEGKGITQPVNQNGRSENQGLGEKRPEALQEEDDEYDAYRKRMMLAYRFRPNPLNNPRRAYY
ncbi:SURP and G-patch domain-containing protein 1 [Chionoecetes opilio]|uniref:SURP and G-patch domain-containing protein 1 n=1 Tax=Chionoecetes opilio TaxID=41210 RepID=A0A8J5D0R6_CHIOP|nr:SURP and G-patch domain-containing protein 1 [Chionoecetes opilio]